MYCTRNDLTDYILADYLAAVDSIDPGKVGRTIANVESEMAEVLVSGGYTVASDAIPATVKRICSVLSAYRSISAVTSLITSEAGNENEFLPLQRAAERAEKELDQIRLRKTPLAAPEADTSQPSDNFVVVTTKSRFGDWRDF